jgi:phenylpropionate dioxygenase-like ring-hydroxylating dioxygenase large terminal subunit
MITDPILLNDWHVVGRSADLPDGGVLRARVLDEDLVLWRHNGRVLAWRDLCIHRGARLSLGKVGAGTLECAYHGWTYNTDGRCVLIPAHPEQTPPDKARVRAYAAHEQYGWLWVCMGDAPNAIPAQDEWDDASFRNILCGPYHFHASAPRVVENFLDVAHFPFVHEGYLGDRSETKIDEYQVETDADGVTARDIRVYQPDPDGTGVGKHVTYTYRVLRPLAAYFVKQAEQQFSILFLVTPVSQTESLGWMCMNMNYAYDVPEDELRAFQDTVAGQDIPIVESQRPELLPLDLQAELHLRSDRTSIAYRKWLGELGLSFGTA